MLTPTLGAIDFPRLAHLASSTTIARATLLVMSHGYLLADAHSGETGKDEKQLMRYLHFSSFCIQQSEPCVSPSTRPKTNW